MKQYTKYNYLWPPRPSNAIPPGLLSFYEDRGWVAQVKKNGTCTVLFVSPDKEIITKTRHNTDHKQWKPTEKSTRIFKTLPGKGWYVFVVEVLHNKTSVIKDTVYIFDILVQDSQLLVGSTLEERINKMKDLFNVQDDEKVSTLSDTSHYVLDQNVWLAKTINSNFEQTMRVITNKVPSKGAPLDEGLVVKNPKAKLEFPGKKNTNNSWQVKCRVQHENYSF